MPRWDQQHRDKLVLEERRLKAAELLRQGVRPAEVARRLAVTPQAVNGWVRLLERGGVAALHHKPRPGREPFVEPETLTTLPDILARGALAFGYQTDLWTLRRLARVLEKEWGVRYTKSGTWVLLKRSGYSWQRPSRQAREKDLVKVARWKRYTYPRLKKKPPSAGPSSSS
ncbi:MAG: winged helix-turn-helix domain-containing protein [Nitrososphaerota archaeon]|nr:winged helix-turn-helix domain-containing protein [Nitrososphaerota archaeon]